MITDYIKKNYKIFIPIILILVLFLSFTVYYLISQTTSFKKIEKTNVYQFFSEEKTNYVLEIEKNRKNVITNITPIDVNIVYDSNPIYNKDNENIVILPQKMSVVAPILNCSEYLAKEKSYIKLENKQYYLVTKGFNSTLGHYFLYDGTDLYFFIENVTLVVDNKEIKLTPYSYVVAHNKKLYYYNKKEDSYVSIDTTSYDNYIYNDYYKVYINGDYIDYSGQKVLLTTDLDKLMEIKEIRSTINY